MDRPLSKQEKAPANLKVVAIAAVLLLGLSAASIYLLAKGSHDEEWLTVESGDIEIIATGSGALVASKRRGHAATEDAYVDSVSVSLGSPVRLGDIMVVLRSPALEREIQTAQTDLAKAGLESEARIADADRDVQHAEAALATARFDLVVAEAELKAHDALRKQGIVSQLTYAQVEARRNGHAARMHANEKLHLLARQRAQRERRAGAANIAAAQQALSRLMERLNALTVRAALDGRVIEAVAEPGLGVRAGDQLVTLGPDRPDQARLQFPQRYASSIKPGSEVRLSFGEAAALAVVTDVSADVQNGQFTAQARLEQVPEDARIDMAVRASATIAQVPSARYVRTSIALPPGQNWVDVEWRAPRAARRVTGVSSLDGYLVFGSDVQTGDEIQVSVDR